MRAWKTSLAVVAVVGALSLSALARQDRKDDRKQDEKKQDDKKRDDRKEPRGGMFGGPPMGGEVRKVLAKYDTDRNGRLDATERKAARKALEGERGKGGFGKGGFGKGGFGKGGNNGTPKAGEKLKPADATAYPKAGLYDTSVLRT